MAEAINASVGAWTLFSTPAACEAFEAVLDAPPKATAGLIELMTRSTPWEKSTSN